MFHWPEVVYSIVWRRRCVGYLPEPEFRPHERCSFALVRAFVGYEVFAAGLGELQIHDPSTLSTATVATQQSPPA